MNLLKTKSEKIIGCFPIIRKHSKKQEMDFDFSPLPVRVRFEYSIGKRSEEELIQMMMDRQIKRLNTIQKIKT